MTRRSPRTVTLALSLALTLACAASGQSPYPAPVQTPGAAPKAPAKSPRRSIVHHYGYPYPGHYHNDSTAGFRNPGGAGRYAEYYPPNNQFQANTERDPVRVARFDTGGGAPDRAEQLQAQQLGIERANSIQNHIDSYSRPYIGYGVGYFGGYY